MLSAAQKISKRIKGKGQGWVFTPQDFMDMATRGNIDMILHRMVQDGDIRRVGRGLYDYPKTHPIMGILAPDTKGIAQAVARQTGDRITHSGATAANFLGLTTQVQGKIIYTTTGKPRKIPVRDKYIRLVSSPVPASLLDWDSPVSMTLQALNNLGKKHVTKDHIQKCARHLSDNDKDRIRKNLRYIKNAWLADVARQLAA